MTIFFLSGVVHIGPGVFENEPPLSIFPFKNREKSRGEVYFVPPVQKKIVNRVLSQFGECALTQLFRDPVDYDLLDLHSKKVRLVF